MRKTAEVDTMEQVGTYITVIVFGLFGVYFMLNSGGRPVNLEFTIGFSSLMIAVAFLSAHWAYTEAGPW